MSKAQSSEIQFEAGCKDWERKLLEASENDPVSIWDGYIRWAQQISSSNPSFLSSLLRRCTKEFQGDERYKNDPRYLRIWIKYIDTSEKPLDLFNHLERNGIGCDLALFYTSWSLVLELKKAAYPEAYSKLEEGITRRARPLEQLQNALKQFEQRMSKRTMEALKSAAQQPAEAESKKALLLTIIETKESKSSANSQLSDRSSECVQKSLEFMKPAIQEPPHFLSQTEEKPASASEGVQPPFSITNSDYRP